MTATSLYRHFDSEGALLYIGISCNFTNRLSQHAKYSDWSAKIARVDVVHFETREEAITREAEAIREERPLHNIRHNRPVSRVSEMVEESATHAVAMVVEFYPVYTIKEAASQLGVEIKDVMSLIRGKRLASFKLEGKSGKTMRDYRITGWQLLEYIEHMSRS